MGWVAWRVERKDSLTSLSFFLFYLLYLFLPFQICLISYFKMLSWLNNSNDFKEN